MGEESVCTCVMRGERMRSSKFFTGYRVDLKAVTVKLYIYAGLFLYDKLHFKCFTL